MSGGVALVAALLLPLAGAGLVLALSRWPDAREAGTLVTGAATLAAVISLLPWLGRDDGATWTPLELLPDVPLAFRVEPLGLLFALVASSLWIVTTVYSIGYMRGHEERHQTRFFTCFAVAIFAALGVAFADNLLTLFVFYEVLTLSTYPLVTHHGTPAARRAGRVYLGLLLGSSIGLLLTAIVWTWVLAGTLAFREGGILAGRAGALETGVLLGLFAFGTGKAALMPLHRWLPAAMVAPTPVSALLHAVAVVKAGVFTILKVAIYVFGLDLLRDTGVGVWLTWVAAFTILAASLVALTRDNLKARLAYSTVSQLGYVVLGAAIAHPWSVVGGAMHIAMHALGKITLFFCAGAIYVAAHKTEISDMAGIGRRMPITTAAFGLASLSVIGLPPLGGSWSKWYLALGAAAAERPLLVGVLMLSSLLSLSYLVPVAARGFFLPPAEGPAWPGVREAPAFCVVPLVLTALGSVALFLWPGFLVRLVEPLVR